MSAGAIVTKKFKISPERFIFIFSQSQVNFRVPEIKAVSEIFGIQFDDRVLVRDTDAKKHVILLDFLSRNDVEKILSRSLLAKTAFQIFYESTDLAALCDTIRSDPCHLLSGYNSESETWRFRVRSYGKRLSPTEVVSRRDTVTQAMTNTNAKVDLKNPRHEFTLIENYESGSAVFYFTRTVGEGQGGLQETYTLKRRLYIGNSTMDPELAFIQANLAQAREGSLVLDPFCGTGGLIISAAHFGAVVVGTEINYQVARGEGRSARMGETHLTPDQTVGNNFAQYKLSKFFGDVIIADASRHGVWRHDLRLDAIVADPPYGVREKSRKVGNKERKQHWTLPGAEHTRHIPEKTKYELNSVFLDLMNLAAKKLVVGGRLAFWFPVARKSYTEDVLPQHPVMELAANCEQILNTQCARRLLLYRKLREPKPDEVAFVVTNAYDKHTFRDVMFLQGRSAAFADANTGTDNGTVNNEA